MAGITDGVFCQRLIKYGFDMVTLGGFNADDLTIKAGKQILSRGRPEFDIRQEDLMQHIEEQAHLINHQGSWDGLVSVNLRSITPEPIIEVSNIENVDVVEINAHCRQPEITDLGCGQELLQKPSLLEDFTKEVVKKAGSQVSVKIRANIPGIDELKILRSIENAGANYIHIDAMKPGLNEADYELIKSIKKSTSMHVIGNNSVVDIKSARKMFAAGADSISIARAAINGKLNFDLHQI